MFHYHLTGYKGLPAVLHCWHEINTHYIFLCQNLKKVKRILSEWSKEPSANSFVMKSKKLNAAILVGFPCSHRKFILRYKSRVSSLQIFDIIIIFWYPLSRLPTKVLPLGYILNTFIVHLFRSLYSLTVKKKKKNFQQALFNDQSLESSEKIIATTQTAIYQEEVEAFEKPHTLHEYSIDHFLPPAKRTLSKALQSQVKRRDKNIPWAFTKVQYVLFSDVSCHRYIYILLSAFNFDCWFRTRVCLCVLADSVRLCVCYFLQTF